MNKKDVILEAINETLTKEERTNMRITRALKFLELKQYEMAKEVITFALAESEFIEQRMALIAIEMICDKADNKYTEEMLTRFYDI